MSRSTGQSFELTSERKFPKCAVFRGLLDPLRERPDELCSTYRRSTAIAKAN
jgi:hypothetical protein